MAYKDIEKKRTNERKQYWLHKDLVNARHRKRYRERRDYYREQRQELKLEVLSHYARGVPACARCRETDIVILCIDHIDGRGNEHRRSIGTGNIYKWLKLHSFPEGFQVLCFNCNARKKFLEDGKDK